MTSRDHVISVTLDPIFAGLMARQVEFQKVLHEGRHPQHFEHEEKAAYIRTQGLALVHELVEAMSETHWKPWTTPPATGVDTIISKDRYLAEIADVFIFTMNMLIVAGLLTSDLAQAVSDKITKNIKRQLEGYDGISSKCPRCKRAYDDDGVECHPSDDKLPAYCVLENGYAY